jgi:hypothetical protein
VSRKNVYCCCRLILPKNNQKSILTLGKCTLKLVVCDKEVDSFSGINVNVSKCQFIECLAMIVLGNGVH